MAKINLDKYYTPRDIALYCIKKTKTLLPNVTEWLEPSAGNGNFSLQLENCLAYDIEPEDVSIIQQDFLTLKLPYKEGRCVIGNPPFGTRNTLSVKFYKKAVTLGDSIAFILPISQLDNNQQMFEFDLLFSEALPDIIYSGKKVNTCFNIYKKPLSGINIKPKNWKLQDVIITEYRRGGNYPIPVDFDFGICTFGSVGKEVQFVGEFCQENYFKIVNEEYKKAILSLLKATDWKNLYPATTTNKIQTWKLYKYLKEQIPSLK